MRITGEQRAGGLAGNARNSCERARTSGLGGTGDHADSMDNPSSREDILEMYVSELTERSHLHSYLSPPYTFAEIIKDIVRLFS